MAQKRVNFRTKVRDVEVDVSIDCQRIARELGERAVRNSHGKSTAFFGAIVVRRVRNFQTLRNEVTRRKGTP